jgi:hypothetical protein
MKEDGHKKMSRRNAMQIIGASAISAAIPVPLIIPGSMTENSRNFVKKENGMITVNPEDTKKALVNPGMGWVMHFYSGRTGNYGSKLEPSDSLDWFPGCSVIYMRIPWSFVEPQEGFFNWTVFDTPAQRFIAKGKKLAIRINCSEHWVTWATPRWVKDAGAKGINFVNRVGPSADGPLWDPDYLDPVFIEKLENLIKALASHYEGNENVAFIDIGTFGMWGEGHTGYSSRLSAEKSAEIVRLQIDLYKKYFKKTLVCINDDMIGSGGKNVNNSLAEYSILKGLALRDDSILVNKYPNAWYNADLAGKFWPTSPVIMEHGHFGMLKARGSWDPARFIEAIETYHTSYLSLHWWPQEYYRENIDIVEKINQRLGYRIMLNELKYRHEVEIGERFKVEWTWSNTGVAPCYPGGFPALTIKDKKSGIVSVLVDDKINIRMLLTGTPESVPRQKFTSIFNIGFLSPPEFFNEFTLKMEQRPGSDFYAGPVTPETKPGLYDLFVSIGKQDGTPVLALPLSDDDGQHRYRVGTILVKDPSVPGVKLENFYIDK